MVDWRRTVFSEGGGSLGADFLEVTFFICFRKPDFDSPVFDLELCDDEPVVTVWLEYPESLASSLLLTFLVALTIGLTSGTWSSESSSSLTLSYCAASGRVLAGLEDMFHREDIQVLMMVATVLAGKTRTVRWGPMMAVDCNQLVVDETRDGPKVEMSARWRGR